MNVEVDIDTAAMSVLNAATTTALMGTPVALLTGATAVTVGTSTAMPPVPRIGARPSPPPPQPAAKALMSSAMNHDRRVELGLKMYISFPFLFSWCLNQKCFCHFDKAVAETVTRGTRNIDCVHFAETPIIFLAEVAMPEPHASCWLRRKPVTGAVRRLR